MEKILIIHSGSYRVNKESGKFELGELAKLRLLAAAKLYKKQVVNKIVLTGGNVFGKGYPTVTSLSTPFLIRRGVLKKDLIVDGRAKDTVGEIELSLPKILKTGRVAVLSDAEHLKRVKILYKNRGVKAEFLAAENILERSSSPGFLLKVREAFLRRWLIFDRKGYFLNKLALFLRN